MSDFIERPYENEKNKAIKYVKQLLDKASVDNKQSDKDELAEILRLLDSKRYGLVWEQHAEKVREKLKDVIPVFKENKDKKLSNKVNDDYNFLLEGDNLYILDLLLRTHREKINLIYIDPPYNTRSKKNEDFKYNDTFVTTADSYPHSKWLSFMAPRLRKAKELLTPDGVIAVSIDNHEGYQLKILMDEIFGENNLVGDLHVETSAIAGPRRVQAMKGSVVKTTEFILIYTKGNNLHAMKRPMYDGILGFDIHYSKFYDGQKQKLINFTQVLKNTPKISETFKQFKLSTSLKNLDCLVRMDNKTIKDWLYSDEISKNLFRYVDKYDGPEQLKVGVNELDGKFIIQNKDGSKVQGYRYFNRIGMSDDYKPQMGERAVRGNLWRGFSADGGNLNTEGGVNFKHGKKPLRLIKQLIKALTPGGKTPITVLDFFAGSGTTGEAVMQLNAEEAGNYKFILGTNDEAIDVAYKRMQNTNAEYPMNLKFFRTDFVRKDAEDLEKSLLDNTKALIELENMTDLNERTDIAIVLNHTQASELNLKGLSKVYMRQRVHRMLVPFEQERYDSAHVEIIDIPDEFFADELGGIE